MRICNWRDSGAKSTSDLNNLLLFGNLPSKNFAAGSKTICQNYLWTIKLGNWKGSLGETLKSRLKNVKSNSSISKHNRKNDKSFSYTAIFSGIWV